MVKDRQTAEVCGRLMGLMLRSVCTGDRQELLLIYILVFNAYVVYLLSQSVMDQLQTRRHENLPKSTCDLGVAYGGAHDHLIGRSSGASLINVKKRRGSHPGVVHDSPLISAATIPATTSALFNKNLTTWL